LSGTWSRKQTEERGAGGRQTGADVASAIVSWIAGTAVCSRTSVGARPIRGARIRSSPKSRAVVDGWPGSRAHREERNERIKNEMREGREVRVSLCSRKAEKRSRERRGELPKVLPVHATPVPLYPLRQAQLNVPGPVEVQVDVPVAQSLVPPPAPVQLLIKVQLCPFPE